MKSGTMVKLANFIGFQVNWFACVLGAAAGRPLIGPVVVGTLLAVHLATIRRRGAELLVLGAAGAVGFLADSLLVWLDLISFPEPARLGGPTTLWMVAMWMNLAATLNSSLGWLQGRPALAAGLGAVGGPLAYLAGARLGAIDFATPSWWSALAVAVEWAVAMPLLAAIAQRAHRGPAREGSSATELSSKGAQA